MHVPALQDVSTVHQMYFTGQMIKMYRIGSSVSEHFACRVKKKKKGKRRCGISNVLRVVVENNVSFLGAS